MTVQFFLAAYLAFGVVTFFSLWIGYVFVTNLDRVRAINGGKLPPFVWFLSAGAVMIAVSADIIFQIFYGTVIFLDIPRELTLSQRMSRYWNEDPNDTNWRKLVVGWVKKQTLIDLFDRTGNHIH